MQQELPADLVPHVWAASLEGPVLTVLVASGAWASRVRYCATEIAAGVAVRLKRPVSRVSIRVRPPCQPRPAGRPRAQPPPRGG